MLLILGLFRVDRFHSVFLRAAVSRAKTLEKMLEMEVSNQISIYSGKCKTATWGNWLYISFCVANWFLLAGVVLELSSYAELKQSYAANRWLVIISTVIACATIITIGAFHHRSKKYIANLVA